MSIVFGIIGVAYARQRLASQNAVSGDDSAPTSQSLSQPTDSAPSSASSDEGTSTTTPDWLKEESSPFGDEDVFSQEIAAPSSETHQPDWLDDTSHTPVVTPETTVESENETEPLLATEPIPEILPESTETGDIHSSSDDVVSTETANIPDWLQGAPVTEDSTEDTTPKFKAL